MRHLASLLGMLLIAGLPRPAFADDPQTSAALDGAPLRYAFVQGDENKFREQNWARDNYGGGIQEFSVEEKNLPRGISVDAHGHAVPSDNDYEAAVNIHKQDFGFLNFDYQEFSKFYDNSGGVYYPFTTFPAIRLKKELELQVGHIRIEAGIAVPEYPHLRVAYERRFKEGSKSRLTWGAVKEGSLTRYIAPSFQDIDEIVDRVELHESHTLRGVELKGEQVWEWMSAQTMREEQSFGTTGVAGDNKIRDQFQNPESRLFSTTESVERWFGEEKIFGAAAYHFLTMHNDELENIFEMNSNRVVTNFTNPKQIRNARADNEYRSNIWTMSLMDKVQSWLNVTPKLRLELMERSGNSAYPSDTTAGAPDGIINTTEISQTDDKVARLGEGLSLRFTKIPRTALYNEFEFEQIRNWLSEDRNSVAGQSVSNANEIFSRETINAVSRGIWTLGGQYVPCHFADLTAHFRINRNNNDYDNIRHTDPGATTARSAFFDAIDIQTEELATHLTLKPNRWLRPSVRYKFQMRDYTTRIVDQADVTTQMDSHIFTMDASLQLRSNLLIVTGLSPQYAWVVSPARTGGAGAPPRFQANILTWLLSVNYDFSERLSFLGNLEFSHTSNFDDFTSEGLPLATSYRQLNFSLGMNYALNKFASIETGYSFFTYDPDQRFDTSHYTANVIGVKTKITWA